MYAVDYHRAASLQDAESVLANHAEGMILAGGQTLLGSLKLRLAQPEILIDLGAVPELRGIEVAADGTVAVGAMTRHAQVAASPEVQRAIPSLASLAGHIGDPQVRNCGTIGGSLANNDPAADYPAAVLGLGATVVTQRREIAADDFFLGMFETALQEGEIIKKVVFPAPRRSAYVKFKHPASRFAIVGVLVADTAQGIRVAVTGAGPVVFRATAIEQALSQRFDPEALADIHLDDAELNNDLHATAAYRANLATVLAQRAVQAVLA